MARPQITLDDEFIERINALVPESAHLDFNSLLREAISRGVCSLEVEMIGAKNKRLVRQKLRQRQGKMAAAVAVLKRVFSEDEPSDQELLDAIATLEKGLSD